LKIVLYSPQIPQNTGNIARTCAVTGTQLRLVRPLGFNLSKRHVKRAGLDYWEDVDLEVFDTLDSALEGPCYFFSSKATRSYTEPLYEKNACLIFGSETEGLPKAIHQEQITRLYTIPMLSTSRCLNLSNSVAIVLYEALRQHNFAHLSGCVE